MRDIVWTIIIIWLVWKIYTAFFSKTKMPPSHIDNTFRSKEGEVKIEKNINQTSRFNSKDGEYVDYEEMK